MQQQEHVPLEKDIEEVNEVGRLWKTCSWRAGCPPVQQPGALADRGGHFATILGQTCLQAEVRRVPPGRPEP